MKVKLTKRRRQKMGLTCNNKSMRKRWETMGSDLLRVIFLGSRGKKNNRRLQQNYDISPQQCPYIHKKMVLEARKRTDVYNKIMIFHLNNAHTFINIWFWRQGKKQTFTTKL